MSAGDTQHEVCRVRHTFTGLYVVSSCRRVSRLGGITDSLCLTLDKRDTGLKTGRVVAEKIADVWIALTGDHGIEIEPVEG